MPKLTMTFVSRRGWAGVALVLGATLVVIAALIGVSILPGILFGTRLTTPEAEERIRSYLVSQATIQFYERISSTMRDDHDALQARYAAEVAPLKAVEFVSVDVDTVIFGYFKISRSFVVKVVIRGKDQQLSTHYFCFVSKYLTGACSKWHWFFAW